jgi:hypothetical protein
MRTASRRSWKGGLKAQVDTSTRDDIHVAAFKSYHTATPNGYNLQISYVTRDNRLALANAVKPKGCGGQVAGGPGYRSRTVSDWFGLTSCRSCTAPEGQRISIFGICASLPRPKWTPAWLEEA